METTEATTNRTRLITFEERLDGEYVNVISGGLMRDQLRDWPVDGIPPHQPPPRDRMVYRMMFDIIDDFEFEELDYGAARMNFSDRLSANDLSMLRYYGLSTTYEPWGPELQRLPRKRNTVKVTLLNVENQSSFSTHVMIRRGDKDYRITRQLYVAYKAARAKHKKTPVMPWEAEYVTAGETVSV